MSELSVDERILRKLLGVDYDHESRAPYAELRPGELVVDGRVDLTDDEAARVAELIALRDV